MFQNEIYVSDEDAMKDYSDVISNCEDKCGGRGTCNNLYSEDFHNEESCNRTGFNNVLCATEFRCSSRIIS